MGYIIVVSPASVKSNAHGRGLTGYVLAFYYHIRGLKLARVQSNPKRGVRARIVAWRRGVVQACKATVYGSVRITWRKRAGKVIRSILQFNFPLLYLVFVYNGLDVYVLDLSIVMEEQI